MGIGSLVGGVVGSILGGGKASSSTTVNNSTQQNPYQDDWIHDRFGQGQSQLDELTRFMNERKAALATPKYYDIGGGQSIRQDQFGEYIQNQLNTKTGDLNRQLTEYQTGVDRSLGQIGQQGQRARDQLMSTYDARLADITSAAGANQRAIKAQSESIAQQGERARANQAAIQQQQAGLMAQQEAMGQQQQLAQAAQEQNQTTQGVKANIKPRNLYRYGTGGSFNRAGLRISSLNI